MRQAIVTLAGERSWHETRQRWLERAARRAGITYRSARALFYGEPHQPRAVVVDSVRAAVEKTRIKEAIARDTELEEFRARLAALEAHMRRTDDEFFISQIKAMRAVSFRSGEKPLEQSGSDRAPAAEDE